MADIQEVIDAMCNYKKFDKTELKSVQQAKAEKRGQFKKKIILEES